MEIDGLVLEYHSDNDGTGQLIAEIKSKGFQGKGAAWFSEEKIRGFISAIRLYPIEVEKHPHIASGFYSVENPEEIKQLLLSIDVYPIGVRGQLRIRLHVETEIWPNSKPTLHNEATIEFYTTYSRIVEFSNELEELINDKKEKAILEVEELN